MPLSTDEQLLPYRNAIGSIDAEILRLPNGRAGHAHAVGELKGTGAMYRPKWEMAVLRQIRDLSRDPLSDESVTRLPREIMSECLVVERPLTIAYLDPKGAFTQQIAIKHFGHVAHTIACTAIDNYFKWVEMRQVDYSVAPMEDPTGGSVSRTLGLLAIATLEACGEVVVRVHHNLLRKDSHGVGGITKVFTHAQVSTQCSDRFGRSLSNVEHTAVVSNAEAARLVVESDNPNAAAIAGRIAAEIYQLSSATECIEDKPNNTTHFLMMGHQDTGHSGNDKTSLVVSTPNCTGTVIALLQPFTELGIFMTKFENRSNKPVSWEYLFFIGIEGYQSGENV